jgi:hemerythrin
VADVIGGVGKGVEIAKDLIPLLKDLIGYFRIRYGVAYESLRLIIDDITKAHESMFYWANRFEHMSREPTKKKQDFDTFSFEFQNFRNSPTYYRICSLVTDLCRIYDKRIKGPLRRRFSRNKKRLDEAKQLFSKICNMGSLLKDHTFSTLLKLEKTIDRINRNHNDHVKAEKQFMQLQKERYARLKWNRNSFRCVQYLDVTREI